jgi:hypothetical protein
VTPGKALTPNDKYAALVEVAGYVPVPLDADDYIELLPVQWRTINSYGVRTNHRTYDAKALNPYRRQHSGVDAHNGQWEVHYDPYDVSRIWVRNHLGMTVPTADPLPLWTSGISAMCGCTNGMAAVSFACSMVLSSICEAKLSSL